METLSIVVMNWRDIQNPEAGGAEVFTHEVAKRWVQAGHEVTMLTSSYNGSPPEDLIDGVQVLRKGGKFGVYKGARETYLERFRVGTDVVLDEINTRPFLTPRYVNSDTNLCALLFQLAREYWFYETQFPVSILGYYFLEKRWLSGYAEVPCVTISNSTKSDLLSLGFKDVRIVPVGLSAPPLLEAAPKSQVLTLIFIGRLIRAKRPEVAIEAFELVRKRIPTTRLWIVGNGYLKEKLERRAPAGVRFFGKVTEAEKFQLLKQANVLLVPGTREGWGLTVLEANAVATPAIGFNIPGLRDSIVHQETGILLEHNTASEMAEWCVRIGTEPDLAHNLSNGALSWSRRFSWEETSRKLMDILRSL